MPYLTISAKSIKITTIRGLLIKFNTITNNKYNLLQQYNAIAATTINCLHLNTKENQSKKFGHLEIVNKQLQQIILLILNKKKRIFLFK